MQEFVLSNTWLTLYTEAGDDMFNRNCYKY